MARKKVKKEKELNTFKLDLETFNKFEKESSNKNWKYEILENNEEEKNKIQHYHKKESRL